MGDRNFKGRKLAELTHVDISKVEISDRAKKQFSLKHGTSDISILRKTLESIINNGKIQIRSDGNIFVNAHGYFIELNSKGNRIISYSTNHNKRTLIELRSGVQSKSKSNYVNPLEISERLDDATIDAIAIPKDLLHKLRNSIGIGSQKTRNIILDDLSAVMDMLESQISSQKISYDKSLNLKQDQQILSNYIFLANGEHKFIMKNYELVLRKDALRVTNLILI